MQLKIQTCLKYYYADSIEEVICWFSENSEVNAAEFRKNNDCRQVLLHKGLICYTTFTAGCVNLTLSTVGTKFDCW